MAARIAAAQAPHSPTVQRWVDRTMPPGREPLVLFTTLARDGRLFERFFSGGLLDRGHLTLREREIVIDRTTARCGSEYEWGVHVAFFARKAELTREQIDATVHRRPGSDVWSKRDLLIVRLADELHETNSVGDLLWPELKGE